MRHFLRYLIMIVAIAGAVTMPARASDQPPLWNKPTEPFRIIGNIYYVGTAGLSSYLITGPKGHILIDGTVPESGSMVARNIEKAGFKLRDVRYLLINHAHFDHCGGLAELKRLTGAQVLASAGDRPNLEAGRTIGRIDIDGFPPVQVDRIIRDGDVIRLGPVMLTTIATPGHTEGATSWTTMAAGKRVIFVSSISVAGQPLVNNRQYPAVVSDFQATFARLLRIKADVFLNYHAEAFDLDAKRRRLEAGDANAFVDPTELGRSVARSKQSFDEELARQQRK